MQQLNEILPAVQLGMDAVNGLARETGAPARSTDSLPRRIVQKAAGLAGLGLHLHPDKTRIVYCRDGRRRGVYEHTSFTFLGYTFQPRTAKSRGGNLFVSFLPAVSAAAMLKMNRQVRHWRLHLWTMRTLDDLADWLNPVVRGWMN